LTEIVPITREKFFKGAQCSCSVSLCWQTVGDQVTRAKPEMPSELELQSSISEPDMADTVAHYSASSDSEMSVELPSCASSSGADKPTTLDWQVPLPRTTHGDASHGAAGKIARRASEEDLEQTRSNVSL